MSRYDIVPISIAFGPSSPSVRIHVEPLLEGCVEPWIWIDADNVAVSPSLAKKLEEHVPVVRA